jgi:dienelactone hydrolase
MRVVSLVDENRLALLDIDPETSLPRSGDRRLEAIVWYPATVDDEPVSLATYNRQFIQDPKWPMPDLPRNWQTRGYAIADAPPQKGETFPLIVLAHGWAGNPAGLTYIGENLASKGYVVVAPDLIDVQPEDPQMFELLFPRAMINRALDLNFVLEEMTAVSGSEAAWLSELIDPERVALIGNSLGGMGALRTAGVPYDGASPGASWIPGGLLDNQTLQAKTPIDVTFEGLDALVLIAPWGAQAGTALFSKDALASLGMPLFVISGELDAIAGYESGPRRIYQEAGSSEKYHLTFEAAGHGITPAPVPMVAEKYAYGAIGTRDAVWRSEAVASIQQHFLTAFLDATLKGDKTAKSYLMVKTERASDGIWPPVNNEPPDVFAPIAEEGMSYWPGFRRHRARGLRLEYETPAGETAG